MRHGSLFSGIGGFDLAAEWMGWENVFHCEISEFPRKVLKYYWPKSISYADITATDFTIHRGNIDVLTGGFPCQPYSTAGKRLGKEDARHLWPEMLRAIREIRPTWIVGENVLGLANWNGGLVFNEVQTDLEAEGYKVQPYVLPAAGINAPHLRNRIWFVAKDTLGNGRILGEPDEEGADVREQRDAGAGDTERVCGEAMAGTAADTKGKGSRQFNPTHREWQNRRFNNHGEDGNAADPNGFRLEHGQIRGEMGGGQGKVGEKGSEFTNAFETDGKDGDAANPDRSRWRENIQSSELWANFPCEPSEHSRPSYLSEDEQGPKGGGWIENSTDPDREMLERRHGEGTTIGRTIAEKRTESFNRAGNWQTFPTQSPVCGGDDGLPAELDGIAFSKWRNESIKGYGNAVVPQVVLQIFKAIEAYEHL